MSTPKFQAPKGFTRQSSNAIGFWEDDGESAILFVPKGVKLMDGSKKTDSSKPSIMIVGELKSEKVTLLNKDEQLEGKRGDIVGVYWKPGMGREIVQAYGIETWIAPLYDERGERKTQNTGKSEPMKLYDVQFGEKLKGNRIPILEDARVESRHRKTPFDDASLAPVRPKSEQGSEEEEDKIPF